MVMDGKTRKGLESAVRHGDQIRTLKGPFASSIMHAGMVLISSGFPRSAELVEPSSVTDKTREVVGRTWNSQGACRSVSNTSGALKDSSRIVISSTKVRAL